MVSLTLYIGCSFSVISSVDDANFVPHIVDYKDSLRNPFKNWASKTSLVYFSLNHSRLNLTLLLLGPEGIEPNDKPTQPQERVPILYPELGRDKDRLPLLPDLNPEDIAMKEVKQLLTDYVALSWSMC